MDSAITDEILEELSSVLQRVEAQSSAILDFIKDKGMIKEDELASYLERASAASSVRWRATRVRLAHLLSGLEKREQQAKDERNEKETHDQKEKAQQSAAHKTSELQASEPDKPERSKAQKPKQTYPQPPRAIQSPKSDVSGAQESHAPESRPKEQEPSKTATAKEPEKPTDKADRRDAA